MTMSSSTMMLVCLLASAQAADLSVHATEATSLRKSFLHNPTLSGWAQDAHALAGEEDFNDEDLSDVTQLNAHQHEPEYVVTSTHIDNNAPTGLQLRVKEEEEKKKAEKADKKEENDDADSEDDEDHEEKLAAARSAAKSASKKVAKFDDEKAFKETVDDDVNTITNETQSPALSEFLGEMRLEMHDYAKPEYPAYLEKRAKAAENRVKELEGKIKAADEAAKPVAKEEAPKEAKLDSVAEIERKAGETWAISFFANVALMACVFGFASAKDSTVKNYTWFIIDQVILIFLAVMYFQAFDSLLDFHGMGVQNMVVASILHAVVMLFGILIIAKMVQGNGVVFGILCGAGAHVSSFASIHAAAGLQSHMLGQSYTMGMAVFGIGVLALGLAIVGFLVYTAKKHSGLLESDDFMDKTDDLENDFGSMAFSVVFTMFVRFLITGHHPEDDEAEVEDRHTETERQMMFAWAVVCFFIAAVVSQYCAKKATEVTSYAAKRVITFVSTVVTMNVAWAVLFWGEWEFFECLYKGEEIKGKVMLAICATILAGVGLFLLTKAPSARGKERKVALTALSLVCAWSWEGCFDGAVEAMTDGAAHPATMKITATGLLFCIVLPIYAIYVKPITGPAAEAIGA